MFYIDLDELQTIVKKVPFLSHNKFNLFNFRDKDHIQFKGLENKPLKSHINKYLGDNNIYLNGGKIRLLTNVNTLGYTFNPVSFYYCYNSKKVLEAVVVEVGNTFNEIKLYLIKKDKLSPTHFNKKTAKYFYVSPFTNMDDSFHFQVQEPVDKLNIKIDDYNNKERFLITTLTGIKKPLTTLNLLWYTIRFPLITVQIIFLIHWQALKLWFKKLPYYKKTDKKHLQQNVFRPHHSLTQNI